MLYAVRKARNFTPLRLPGGPIEKFRLSQPNNAREVIKAFSGVGNTDATPITVTARLLRKTFHILDAIYFDGTLSSYLRKHEIGLKFSVKSACHGRTSLAQTRSAYSRDRGITAFEICFRNSWDKHLGPVFTRVFGEHTGFDAFVRIYEHEMVHILLRLFAKNLPREDSRHDEQFEALAARLFGHHSRR